MESILFTAASTLSFLELQLKQCWSHTSVLAVAEQCMHNVKTFSFPTLFPSELTEERQPGQLAQIDHSVLHNIMFNNRNWGKRIWGEVAFV